MLTSVSYVSFGDHQNEAVQNKFHLGMKYRHLALSLHEGDDRTLSDMTKGDKIPNTLRVFDSVGGINQQISESSTE